MKLATRIDGPVAVIGDVHGHVDKLRTLLGRLKELPAHETRWVVFIGDFIDRGPDSRAVVDEVLQLCRQHRRTTAIAGNHEFALASALGLIPTPSYSNWAEQWLKHYEAEATFASYGAEFPQLERLAERMPAAHRRFFAELPWCVEHPEFLFVHAGLNPNSPFEMQRRILAEQDFSLGRPQWLCEKFAPDSAVPPDCRATVVSGHVQVPEVQFRRRRILIDTCHAGGDLSCVLLPEKRVLTSGTHQPAAKSAPKWKFWSRVA